MKAITFSGARKVRDRISDFRDSALSLPDIHVKGLTEPRVYYSTVHDSQDVKSTQIFSPAYIEVLTHYGSYSILKKSEAVSFATK